MRRLLQLRQNASVFAQGCADFSSDSSDRKHSFTPDPRRASPSLRPGLSFRYTQVGFHTGFPSRRFISSNVETWVLFNQDSSIAPQTLQDARPVCGTKNFTSVRL